MSPERVEVEAEVEVEVEVEVDGRIISLSNLNKVFYPDVGFTKRDVIDYYSRIADVMLPHIQDRPITLKRFPNGVDGAWFFEKHAPAQMPEWVRTVDVPSTRAEHQPIEFAIICDRPTLIWAANLAALEFHVPLWRVRAGAHLPSPPDYVVFDLDPGPGTTIVDCCRVALWIADKIDSTMAAKTSGSKGLQLYLPVDEISWEQAGERAHELARAVEADHPDAVISNMRKDLRGGKVLIDWSQNSPAKTTVAAYSLRARSVPTVSAPVTWDEIESCASADEPAKLRFEAHEVLERVERLGDLMRALLARDNSKTSDTSPARAPSRRKSRH